jgi:arylsulfatase A-like enzyme
MMDRRSFLRVSGIGVFALASGSVDAISLQKPNVLIIMTDQQFADCMSCVMGNEYLHTPHMDALADNGVRFTRAYSPNPLCVPMRTSMITGRYPHETRVQNNSSPKIDPSDFVFMGKLFKDSGYETAYFGKWHVAFDSKQKEVHGFDEFDEDKITRLNPARAVEFIKKSHDRPFLAVASFLGPHEICEWARKEDIPGEQLPDVPPLADRPPLRVNAAAPKHETDIMTHMRKSYQAARWFPVGDYTEDDWRRHIWGYYQLIERVDGYVGSVLTALRESGQDENTVVVFLSDHGDCHGAHLWNQKTVFYDESARVPFIISWKGKTPKGVSNTLLNTGTDVIPTICDFAGIDVPDDLPGKSLKAFALGGKASWKRDYVVVQNHMVQCVPVDGKDLQPHGRMVRSDRYKYCLYSDGDRRESLVDMEKDPGETVNQADNPKFKDILNQHRAFLKEHAERHTDKMALEMLRSLA